jgi:hypothetical protein
MARDFFIESSSAMIGASTILPSADVAISDVLPIKVSTVFLLSTSDSLLNAGLEPCSDSADSWFETVQTPQSWVKDRSKFV